MTNTHKGCPQSLTPETITFGDHEAHVCDVCQRKKGFTVHHSLFDEFRKGNVVIFADAGVSTEDKNVLGFTLFEDVCGSLSLDKNSTSFPDAMEALSARPNGRLALISKIRDRLEYVDSFPELHIAATKFPNELATLYLVNNIITTNWDTYFERKCAAQPFFTPSDFSFWDAAERRVLKIHGSISNFGSLIATRSDYDRNNNELREGVLGSFLKTLLSTKTIVFCGYSVRDDDFNQVWEFIRSALGPFGRQHYAVTLDEKEENTKRLSELGLIPICTDATYFIEVVKEHLLQEEHLIRDDVYDEVEGLLDALNHAHNRLYEQYNCFDDPEIVMCGSYQDGMMHALERVLNLRPTGQYSHRCRVDQTIQGYEKWKRQKLAAKKYADVAYIEGYQNALIFVASHGQRDKEILPPLYFLYGKKPFQMHREKDFKAALKDIRRTGGHHAGALKEAKAATAKYPEEEARKVIVHHKCSLL